MGVSSCHASSCHASCVTLEPSWTRCPFALAAPPDSLLLRHRLESRPTPPRIPPPGAGPGPVGGRRAMDLCGHGHERHRDGCAHRRRARVWQDARSVPCRRGRSPARRPGQPVAGPLRLWPRRRRLHLGHRGPVDHAANAVGQRVLPQRAACWVGEAPRAGRRVAVEERAAWRGPSPLAWPSAPLGSPPRGCAISAGSRQERSRCLPRPPSRSRPARRPSAW